MNTFTQAPSEKRLRMIEDMRMRKFELRTREAYIRVVRKLAKYLRHPPETATAEELRRFQLHLVDQGVSPITLNATTTGLKFSYKLTACNYDTRLRHFALLHQILEEPKNIRHRNLDANRVKPFIIRIKWYPPQQLVFNEGRHIRRVIRFLRRRDNVSHCFGRLAR